jgi:hypothetical protein
MSLETPPEGTDPLDALDALNATTIQQEDPDSEEAVLKEDTVSSRMLKKLIAHSEKEGIPYGFSKGRFGIANYTLGDKTMTLTPHINEENIVRFAVKKEDLETPWWNDILAEVLSPEDIILE